MSALTISAESPAGVLADGTPYYAPLGEVIVDGSLVTCHLCGRALRSVTAHLHSHGWAWAAIAAECAQPSSWLRRQARLGSPRQPQGTMPNDLRAATGPACGPASRGPRPAAREGATI